MRKKSIRKNGFYVLIGLMAVVFLNACSTVVSLYLLQSPVVNAKTKTADSENSESADSFD